MSFPDNLSEHASMLLKRAIACATVAQDVMAERARQDAKWGEQNHPDGTGRSTDAFHRDSHRVACDSATSAGTVTWRHILTEEFWEAMAEADPAKLRAELVQVAAVACAWVEAIDRRT